MHRSILTLLVVLTPVVAYGADRPDWAFPVADQIQPPSQDDDQPKTLTGSTKSYTQKQIDDLKKPPDWFPDMHPPMPPVVAKPLILAATYAVCAFSVAVQGITFGPLAARVSGAPRISSAAPPPA